MFLDDALNSMKPSLINALATGTKYSSFESVDLMPSFRVLLAEESCALVIYLTLMALYKATERIIPADSLVSECIKSFSPVQEFTLPSVRKKKKIKVRSAT